MGRCNCRRWGDPIVVQQYPTRDGVVVAVATMCRGALPVLLLIACASRTDSSERSASAQPTPAPAHGDVLGTERAGGTSAENPWSGRVVVAGHAAARFRFLIPSGLAPLRGITPPPDRNAAIEFQSQGPDGVGIADGSRNAMNSIAVFSDPAGLGVVFDTLDETARQKLAARYVEAMREAIPDAQTADIIKVGTHLALRINLPRVAMEGRPLRRGRHYLLFDQAATASIDCLWTDAEAARMTSACEAVATGLERVSVAR